MVVLHISADCPSEDGIVQPPRATDVIGAALRGVFGNAPSLPDDMARLLALLDRPAR